MSLRLASFELPNNQPLKIAASSAPQSPSKTLTEALELYLRVKGAGKSKPFHRGSERNIMSVIHVLGDRQLSDYTSSDAASYRDHLLERGLSSNSVKRNFATIRSIINFAIQEHGLDCRNAFSRVYLPDLDDAKMRLPIPIHNIFRIQEECIAVDDEVRRLIALISDTGMRLSEASGLLVDDIQLEQDVPFVDVKPHAWRKLKTKSSSRQIPLVGASLWAAKRITNNAAQSPFAFPRYTNQVGTNANSASATINKWLKPRVPNGCVAHSFRHSMRDRLRAVECPSDMIDQIGGWQTVGVGNKYGNGYELPTVVQYMSMITNLSKP